MQVLLHSILLVYLGCRQRVENAQEQVRTTQAQLDRLKSAAGNPANQSQAALSEADIQRLRDDALEARIERDKAIMDLERLRAAHRTSFNLSDRSFQFLGSMLIILIEVEFELILK